MMRTEPFNSLNICGFGFLPFLPSAHSER